MNDFSYNGTSIRKQVFRIKCLKKLPFAVYDFAYTSDGESKQDRRPHKSRQSPMVAGGLRRGYVAGPPGSDFYFRYRTSERADDAAVLA